MTKYLAGVAFLSLAASQAHAQADTAAQAATPASATPRGNQPNDIIVTAPVQQSETRRAAGHLGADAARS